MGNRQKERFLGKAVVVTAGDRGIGAATVRRLGDEGAAVVVGYRRDAVSAEALVTELASRGQRAAALQVDVADPEQIRAFVDRAARELGRIDVLVSCASIEHFERLERISPADFDRVFAVNTRGQLFAVQCAATHLRPGGRIVLTSSVSASRAVFGHALDAASKAAVEAMVLNLSAELGPRAIGINAIAPGGAAADMAAEKAGADMSLDEWLKAHVAFGRLATLDEIAAAYAFLASGDSAYITGRTLRVDGGYF
jgi:tetrahydroxynaphthalene reductase